MFAGSKKKKSRDLVSSWSFHQVIHGSEFLNPELEQNEIRWIKKKMAVVQEDKSCFIHENTAFYR